MFRRKKRPLDDDTLTDTTDTHDPFFLDGEEDPADEDEPVVETVPVEEVVDTQPRMENTGRLIDMRRIVKTYNVGEPSELTVLHITAAKTSDSFFRTSTSWAASTRCRTWPCR